MTFIIDYDQLAPVMFFIGLLIGYLLRKIQRKGTGALLRAILFLLVFVIVFIVKNIVTLAAFCLVTCTLALLTIQESVSTGKGDLYTAYFLTLGLTPVSIFTALILLGQYHAAILLLLRVITIGTLCMAMLSSLPFTRLVGLVRLFLGQSISPLFLVTLLIFRKTLSELSDLRTMFEIRIHMFKSIRQRIQLMIDIVRRRIIPIVDRISDDIVTALMCKGIDIISGINIRPAVDIHMEDLLISILLLLTFILMCIML